MEELVDDAIQLILHKINYTDLSSFACISKRFMIVCSSEKHFKQRVELEYPVFKKAEHLTNKDFYKMLKLFENSKAKMYEISSKVFSWSDYGLDYYYNELEDFDLNMLTAKILPYLTQQKITLKRGDLIHLESESEYRNDGKYIFDGDKFTHLNFDYNDYGELPLEYTILDDELTFSATYWMDVLNDTVSFNIEKYVDQLLNLEETNKIDGLTTYKTSILHSTGAQFTIYFVDVLNKFTKQSSYRKRFELYPTLLQTPYSIFFYALP